MTEINKLSADAGKNANQITRWVVNKESHATKIQNTMLDYFLAQRLKPAEMESDKEAYLKKLTLSHQIIVLAMKCKQGTDLETAKKLHAHFWMGCSSIRACGVNFAKMAMSPRIISSTISSRNT